MYSYGPPHMAVRRQDNQHEHIFSSYVRIRDVVLKTCLGRWTIGRSGERGSGISVLPAWHDDDDIFTYICIHTHTHIYIYIYICIYVKVYIYIYSKLVKLATIVEGEPKVLFLIATTPRCRWRYSFPWIAPFYPWSVPYNAEC